MKNKYLILILLILPQIAFTKTPLASQCVPAKELIPFPKNIELARYHRFSPDGNTVLSSFGAMDHKNNVMLIRISSDETGANTTEVMLTTMKDETYPVEGMKNKPGNYEWSLLTSPYDDKAMGFYEIGTDTKNDVLKHGEAAKAIYSDPNHTEYYHSAAAVPSASGDTSNFRVMLYQKQRMKDYKMTKNTDGSLKVLETSKAYSPCKNLETMTGPILSKDSSMISFTKWDKTSIYKIDYTKKECHLVREIGYSTGKVSFNYPNQEPVVVFGTKLTYEKDGIVRSVNAVQTFNYKEDGLTDVERIKNISEIRKEQAMGYPGILSDGRVMYISRRINANGEAEEFIVRADPKQINNNGSINKEAAKNGICTKKLRAYIPSIESRKESSGSSVIQE
jgi:hypothetical protein